MSEEIEDLKKQVEYLQQQLNKQEKMASLGLLSAGIAHEIQNPLNFVINFSKMSVKLLEDMQGIVKDCEEKLGEDDAADLQDISEDLKENLAKIQEHGERAISIIRGILLQSRGKAGEMLPTDIGQLVHEYVWLSYHAMRANDKNFNISIQEEIPEGLPKFMVVPQDLSRAVLNVMNNACYTVRERTALEGPDYKPTIQIKVAYTLFENFFTTKPAGQGTGLGMGITYELITKNHKGQLLVETKPKVGSTFTFIIPVKIVK